MARQEVFLADAGQQEFLAYIEGKPTNGLGPVCPEVAQRRLSLESICGAVAEAFEIQVETLLPAAANGYLKEMAAMIARSEYAINCGSQNFYRARSGRLFFPDHKYTPGGYGYDGSDQSVTRPVAGLTGSDDPALFVSEAYNLDAYRFTVKPGKPVLSDFDLFTACDSNFHKAIVREFTSVEAHDGVLSIEFSLPPGRSIDPTARPCDAIEVIPEP